MVQTTIRYSGEALAQDRKRLLVIARGKLDGDRLRAGQQELLRGK